MYRLDIEGCNEDHYGKVKIVAKNENGESAKEVSTTNSILKQQENFSSARRQTNELTQAALENSDELFSGEFCRLAFGP